MTIGELEQQAGITDRTAFWMQFAHIRGQVRKGHIVVDKGLETGIAQLRWMIEQRAAA